MIDAHQHFWHPARGDYGWIPEGDAILDRAYGPADLAPDLAKSGVERTIIVQAAPSVEETEYMLGIADATPSVAGVVGWINFENPGDRSHLERLAAHPKFLGVRPMIQDIPDVDWMLRDDIQWAFEAIVDLNLSFDALGFPRHLDNFLTLFTRYPNMRVVLDHCMKPEITRGPEHAFAPWAAAMQALAEQTTAYCKLSGLVTEDGTDWTVVRLRPYTDHVLACFGPERVMWGSDWPVCRLRCEYGDWVSTAQALTSQLSTQAREAVFGRTARAFYRLRD
ncbi:MAG: amidohydrolase family protein [Pseudomonadota bacterium]